LRIVRVHLPGSGPRLGVLRGEEVLDATQAFSSKPTSFNALLEEAYSRNVTVERVIEDALRRGERGPCWMLSDLDIPPSPHRPYLLRPLDPEEVWGAGVTYMRSVRAREAETGALGLYDRVYSAARPEIFFKATASRCVGPNQPICVRGDSRSSVPEAELTLVLGGDGEIVGYTVGNDVTARDIEGENPLYLPQAKIFAGCCAIGPAIATPEELPQPNNLGVACSVLRGGETVFEGSTSTSRMKRGLAELAGYVARENVLPLCTLLLTGTGIVPPEQFSLRDGDVVEISIEGMGTLRNPVKSL